MNRIRAGVHAIELCEPGKPFSCRKIAKEFVVVRSTLTRAHEHGIPKQHGPIRSHSKLTHQQEAELLQYIRTLTERSLPPTRQMLQSFASTIAHEPVSMSWVDRFTAKNKESLIPRWTSGMDRNRHIANSPHKYKLYFSLLRSKIDQY